MGANGTTVRYCTVAGDEVATTWEQARADLIVEGLPMRVPPTYQGQRSYPGLFWAATNDRTLVYESLLELDRLWLADRYSACFPAEHLSELDRPRQSTELQSPSREPVPVGSGEGLCDR
ncbi:MULTISPECIES: hypothetical protein [Brachybacterium]|uniref:hypothetical protein n=1 Tax=Brachybacterium TaxID=43668 RepID=UPI0006B65B62|nr:MULTISPECIES: hypothetical protein [Brachybacterium]